MAIFLIMAFFTLLMNTIAHIFEPPHSVFLREIKAIKNNVKDLKMDIENGVNVLQASNLEIIELIKSTTLTEK